MAIKTFYLLNTTATAPGWWGSLQEGGSAPAAALSVFGWTIAKVATTTPYWFARLGATGRGTEAANTSWIANDTQPFAGSGSGAITSGDSFVTPSAYTGTFASGNWTFNFGMRTGAATHAGRMRFQIWAGTNLDGTGARKIGALQTCSTVTLAATATTYTSTLAYNPGAVTLTGEYLFFQLEWNHTTAGGSNSCTTQFYQSAGSIVTPDFAPSAQTLTQSAAHSDADSFNTHGLLASYGLTQGARYDGAQTFNAHDLTQDAGGPPAQDLASSLHTNNQSFQAPIAQRGMVGGLYTNPQTFPTPIVQRGLLGTFYLNPQTFYAPALASAYALTTPPIYNGNGYFVHTVGRALQPPLTVNVSNFLLGDPYFFLPIDIALTVAAYPLEPAFFSDPDDFFGPTVAASTILATGVFLDPDTFSTPAITVGGVTMFPLMYNDPDTFFGASMTGGIPVEVTFAHFHPFLENVGQIWERT